MLALLGSLLGFGTSFLPKVMDFFQDKQDKAHELNMMDKQLEQQKLLGDQRLEMVNVEADIAEVKSLHRHDSNLTKTADGGWQKFWVGVSMSVRPVITYWFFGMFSMIKTAQIVAVFLEAYMIYVSVQAQLTTVDGIMQASAVFGERSYAVWDDPTAALFAAVISFWFGQRMISKWQKSNEV